MKLIIQIKLIYHKLAQKILIKLSKSYYFNK
jgi:hypothetical protein